MTNQDEIPKEIKDKESIYLSATERQENSIMQVETERKKTDKANPDVEDPRLYSPLQEPDSPPVEERTTNKVSVEQTKPDEV
ncbi:hypothetical protein ACFLXC_05585 [Chloroflexota bacterium]